MQNIALLGVLLFSVIVESSRILIVFPKPAKSHVMIGEGIALALADAGHQVTFVSPRVFESNKSNIISIDLPELLDTYNVWIENFHLQNMIKSPLTTIAACVRNSETAVSNALRHPRMKNLLASGSFDLVIVELFVTEALLGLGQHFGAPVIAVATVGASQWTNSLVSNPSPLSYVPHVFSAYSSKMKILDRMMNIFLETYESFMLKVFHISGQVYTISKCICILTLNRYINL